MMTLKQYGQELVYKGIHPFIKLLLKLGVTPNFITFTGLILNVLAAVVFVAGAEWGNRSDHSYVGWAGAIILFAGLFDMIDGRLARMGNMANPYGCLLYTSPSPRDQRGSRMPSSA